MIEGLQEVERKTLVSHRTCLLKGNLKKDASVSHRVCLLSSYSIDEGESWNSYKFTNQSAIRIYGILTEPGEKTTVFSIFGSKPDHHSWILFQLNVSGLLGQYSLSPLLTLLLLLLTTTITIYFIHPSGKLKLSSKCTTQNISQ